MKTIGAFCASDFTGSCKSYARLDLRVTGVEQKLRDS